MALSKSKLIFSFCVLSTIAPVYDNIYDIKCYIMKLLINLYPQVSIRSNCDGFTITNGNEILILIGYIHTYYEKFKLEPYNDGEIEDLLKLNPEKFRKHHNINIHTVGLIQTGIFFNHCMIVISKTNDVYVSKYLSDGSVWSGNIHLLSKMKNLVKMNFPINGNIIDYSCTRDAFFIIIDRSLYIVGDISNEMINIPMHVEFPEDETVISIKCVRKHAHVLTSKGHVYSVQTNVGIKVNRINVPKIRSIFLLQRMSYMLTFDGRVIMYDLERSQINVPQQQIETCEKVMKIGCTPNEIFISTNAGKMFSIGHNGYNIINTKFQLIPIDDVTDFECGDPGTVIVTKKYIYYKGNEIDDECTKIVCL